MKKLVHKLDESAVLARFPIPGKAPGWFFRLEEIANGCWLGEGTDLWGRTVRCDGFDDAVVLASCEEAALRVASAASASTPGREIGG